MPVDVTLTDGGAGFVAALTGEVAGAELLAATDQIFGRDLKAEPYLYGLVDTDDLSDFGISTAELQRLADKDVEFSRDLPDLVLAIYAKHDGPFGVARMWQAFAFASGWRSEVFRDRDAAVTWLRDQVRARTGRDIAIA